MIKEINTVFEVFVGRFLRKKNLHEMFTLLSSTPAVKTNGEKNLCDHHSLAFCNEKSCYFLFFPTKDGPDRCYLLEMNTG